MDTGSKGRGEGPGPRGRDPTAPQLQAPSKQSCVLLMRVQRALQEKLNARSSNTASLPSIYKIFCTLSDDLSRLTYFGI